MIQNIKKFVLVAFVVFSPAIVLAQDFHFSQYYAAPMTLNPALTGQFNGKLRVSGIYRQQWTRVEPYQTPHISVDGMVTDKIGLGGYVLNQSSANGALNSLNAGLNLAIDLPMGVSKTNHLSLGLGAGIIRNSIDFNKLIFENQIGATTGSLNDPVSNTDSKIVPDVNAGLLFYSGSPYQTVNFFIGGTAFHLPQFDMSFSNTAKDPLYRRFLVHGGVRFKASEELNVNLSAIAMRQQNTQEIMPSASLQYYLTNADLYIIGGAGVRINDAVIPYFGFQKGELSMGLSYDITTSRFDIANKSYGAWEISIGYIIKPKVAEPKFICPRI
jgi:type IX secretion system PorP/SprF family membrane protein